MKLENLLNTIEMVETEDIMTNNIFKQKLENLREYQKETELRKDKISETLFPEKIRRIIEKLTYDGGSYAERKDKAIKINRCNFNMIIYYYESDIKIEMYGKSLRLAPVKHKFNKIYDWWASELYRNSHMVTRANLLNNENKIMDIVESNIAVIYEEIAKRVEQDTLQKRQTNMDNLAKLNKPIVEESKKQTVIITIRIEE